MDSFMPFICILPLLLLLPVQINGDHPQQNLQTYIIQLHPHGTGAGATYSSKLQWHQSFLHRTLSSSGSEEELSSRLLYSYDSAMEGFAALLSEDEVDFVRGGTQGVVAIRPDRQFQIQTTYSYKFLGLNGIEGGWSKSGSGYGSIIGVLDTGVWPESPSFDDSGMPPVPTKWNGICQFGQDFNSSNCNRKIIGARYFSKGHLAASLNSNSVRKPEREYLSARDSHGHGSHTASTAGGSPVSSAGVLGNGGGTARGMAPGAHLAVYKVCWSSGCYSSDILAAMDAAIKDGVDVLSLSLGGFPVPLYEDSIAIGSFRAMEHGITVVCAAGNNGPSAGSVANDAPWILTVGASTLDRRFPAIVRTSNGKYIYGESIYPGKSNRTAEKEMDLVYIAGSELCIKGSLPRQTILDKMVVCDRGVNSRAEKGEAVKEAGGSAMILANTAINMEEDSVDAHVLPATLIGFQESIELKTYINSTKQPRARIIFGGTVVGKSKAPTVAQFSSRGPSFTNPSILKPDVIAPGVNIIAAWPQNLGPSALPEDPRRGNFSILSGTSMSCPHVGGIAALLHSAHPRWTSSAIKSAIMTTSEVTDHFGKPIMDGRKPAGVFAMGAGHVSPSRAINPGLVYDITPLEYLIHLCTLGYSRMEIFSITHRNISCHEALQKYRGFSLNYPTISVILKPGMTRKMIRRRLTNVGSRNSSYSVEVTAPRGVKVIVKPKRLVFKDKAESLSYTVWFLSKKKAGEEEGYGEGQLSWVPTNGNNNRISSPISVIWRASSNK